ncbi:F-box protein At3g07870-like [Salvia hispanica]|uniref:F-box protein At3g07870-like n=1 Tax=Salvia hispanica TaxID=49212 RepID=UPI0020098412|nr:F-box protein At3g07870-like [Salvia hispanica]
MKKTAKSEIGEDLFRNLPSEIVSDILSRLDVRTAMSGKCVCKSWLDLLTTPEFVKSHLSKSVPCLTITELNLKLKSVTYKMVIELDFNCDWHRLNTVFHFDLPFRILSHCSINGLIFLKNNLDCILCNPITREYIKLPCPRQPSTVTKWEIYGFGVSRMSGQYKLVRTSVLQRPPHLNFVESECQVYTLGTGLWRRIGECGQFEHLVENSVMALVCGNLHWWWKGTGALVPTQISHLDLETESFGAISCPSSDDGYKERCLSSLRGCLCVCDNRNLVIDIWVMTEYGDEKSWTKQFRMLKDNVWGSLKQLDSIQVYRNGDMLMTRRTGKLLYHSSNTKTVKQVKFDSDYKLIYQIRLYTPSFLSLKTFATENVRAFTMELGGGGAPGEAPLRLL